MLLRSPNMHLKINPKDQFGPEQTAAACRFHPKPVAVGQFVLEALFVRTVKTA